MLSPRQSERQATVAYMRRLARGYRRKIHKDASHATAVLFSLRAAADDLRRKSDG